MIRWLRAGLAVLTLALGALAGSIAQGPASPPGKDSKPPPAPAKSADAAPRRITLDKLKLPPGAIIVTVEQAREALELLPKMILVSPEKWQEMLEKLSSQERQLKADKKLPSMCNLSGQLDGDVVRLQAEYKFKTDRPRTVVFLGGQGAVLTEPRLDPGPANPEGQLPFLEAGESGYTVQVEKAGEHVLTLQFQLRVVARASAIAGGGSERAFELGLPGAAVTSLALELPRTVKEVRSNEPRENKLHASSTRPGLWTLDLGVVKNLNVSWKEPVTVPGAGPLRTADGQITVQVEESQVVTTAELTLEDLRGQAREWRVWVPPAAKLEVKTPPGLGCDVLPPANPGAPFLLRLSEPTTERFYVVAQVRQARPFAKLLVGPFTVLDAYRQQGIITIKAPSEATRGLKLVYHRQADVVERDAPNDPADVVALFKYWNMLLPGASPGPRPPRGGPLNTAPLEIELQQVKGTVETQVEHTLQLKRVQEGWQVLASTRIHAKPVHDGVDYLEVQLPRARPEGLAVVAAAPAGFPVSVPWAALALAGQPHWPVRVPLDYELEGEEGAATAELMPPTPARKVGIKLNRFQSRKFTVVLTGTYTLPAGASSARLEMPRPLGILDRGARVKVEVEGNVELLANDGAPDSPVPHRHQTTTVWQRTPLYVDLTWRPYRPELPVRISADITLRKHHAHVRQELRFPAGETEGTAAGKGPAAPLRLLVPTTVRGLKVIAGGTLQSLDAGRDTAWITSPADAAAREPVVVEFDFPLPGRAPEAADQRGPHALRFKVPLLWPESATRAETRVRFWCDPGTVPTLAGADVAAGPWRDQGTEIVAGRDSLPALVVAGDGLNLPLNVRLLEPTGPAQSGVVVDRALIQVTVDEEGTEYYRARFVLSKLDTRQLDVELPAPPAALMLQVALDHKQVPWRPMDPGSKVVRLSVEPSLYTQPVVLDLGYRQARGRPEGENFWRNSLQAPVLPGEVLLGRVRWQVTFPGNLVSLVPTGDAYVEQHWAWHGWLPMPEPATTAAELEHWLGSGESGDAPAMPSLVCWRTGLAPLSILRVPQQVWLLACSGLFLAVGLGLSFVPWNRFSFWLLALLLGLGVGAAAMLWPSIVPAVLYGCQPGVLVLLLVLGIQWMLQRRYRRQVVFMPGFTRLKPGSSLVRTGGAGRPREASTIDAPPAAHGSGPGSSVSRGN